MKPSGFTLKDIERLKAEGKIRDYQDQVVKTGEVLPKPASKKKGQKIKEWIKMQLSAWAHANKLELAEEFQFDTERRFRFDYAIPLKLWAWEYEGLNSEKSGHTTKTGYTKDTDKYNEAQRQGWKVFRYTALNHKNLLKDLDQLL